MKPKYLRVQLILLFSACLSGCISGDSQRHREVRGPAEVRTSVSTPWGTHTFAVTIWKGGRMWFGPDYHEVGGPDDQIPEPELEGGSETPMTTMRPIPDAPVP